jgi:hypothetical protein
MNSTDGKYTNPNPPSPNRIGDQNSRLARRSCGTTTFSANRPMIAGAANANIRS